MCGGYSSKFSQDKRRLESRILPVLGSKTLTSFTGYELDQYIKKTLSNPWSNGDKKYKTLGDQSRKYYFLLFTIFHQARPRVTFHNPMSKLEYKFLRIPPSKVWNELNFGMGLRMWNVIFMLSAF
jgi:hypothetical protein